jgi:hypothetical protein
VDRARALQRSVAENSSWKRKLSSRQPRVGLNRGQERIGTGRQCLMRRPESSDDIVEQRRR